MRIVAAGKKGKTKLSVADTEQLGAELLNKELLDLIRAYSASVNLFNGKRTSITDPKPVTRQPPVDLLARAFGHL